MDCRLCDERLALSLPSQLPAFSAYWHYALHDAFSVRVERGIWLLVCSSV